MSDVEDVGSNRCAKCNLCREKPEIPVFAPFSVRISSESRGTTMRWCSCGKSVTQPYCDDSCVGSAFRPVEFQIPEKSGIMSICGCKYTSKPPYCDGSHATMPFEPLHAPCNCDQNDINHSGIRIRTGRENDCDFYVEGNREMFEQMKEPFTTEKTDRAFFAKHLKGLLVAECGGERVGYLLAEEGRVTPFMPDGPEWWNAYLFIADIFVKSSFRRRGVAQQLIARAYADFGGDLEETFAACYSDNISSVRLFEKLGFEKFAIVDHMNVRSEAISYPKLNTRKFDIERDRDIVVEGLRQTAEKPERFDVESELEIFRKRLGEFAEVLPDAHGEAMAWMAFEISNETPCKQLYQFCLIEPIIEIFSSLFRRSRLRVVLGIVRVHSLRLCE